MTGIEGAWDGHVMFVEFPDRECGQQWCGSPGYQEILPRRTGNSHSMVAVLDGVPAGHQATDKLAELLATQD